MIKTYSGGCHCGAVRYEADLDLVEGTVKCNCSICSKSRTWLAAVAPGKFRLLKGAESLSEYQFGPKRIRHMFCKTCGIKSFARGAGPDGQESGVVIVSCLDDVPDAELAAAPVIYVNGRKDDFATAPEVTAHL
jgi:hypothetical protein